MLYLEYGRPFQSSLVSAAVRLSVPQVATSSVERALYLRHLRAAPSQEAEEKRLAQALKVNTEFAKMRIVKVLRSDHFQSYDHSG